MELRHLRYFSAVAKRLSFSRAAESLHIAQPALSRQIKDLEDEMGFKLFDRTTVRVKLTDAGQYFFQESEKLLVQLDASITAAQKIARGSATELNIGVDWSFPSLPVAAAARQIRTLYPNVAVKLHEITAHEIISALRAKKIDLGFVTKEMIGSRKALVVSKLYSTAISAIVPCLHPLAGRKSIRLRELKEELWLTLEDSQFRGFKTFLAQYLRPASVIPRFGRSASSLTGMIGLVSSGEGICIVPDLFLPYPDPSIRMLATDGKPMEVMAVWRESSSSPFLAHYMSVLHAEFQATAPASSQTR